MNLTSTAKARFFYAGVFFLNTMLALVLREEPPKFLQNWATNDCETRACQGTMNVLKVSFALAIFFSLLLLSQIGASRSPPGGWQDQVMYEYWFFKALLFLGILTGALFMPTADLRRYSDAARVLAVLFLLLQLVLLIEFAYAWNESWVERGLFKPIVAVSVFFNAAAFTLFVLGLVWFTDGNGESACHREKFFLSLVFIIPVMYTVVSLYVDHGALLTSSVVTFYFAYANFSALLGHKDACNSFKRNSSTQTWLLICGSVIAAASLAYNAFRSSGGRDAFRFEKQAILNSDVTSEEGRSTAELSGYAKSSPEAGGDADGEEAASATHSSLFFQAVFLLASFYMAMLLTGWGSDDPNSSRYEITEGVTGLWLRVVSSWAMVLMYTWSLVAPLVLKNREFG